MALITDIEIRQALERKEVEIEPFEEKQLQPASYDLRLGPKAIISRSVTIEELKGKIIKEEAKEIDVAKEQSIRIPGGAFALISTLERVKFSRAHAGHIGMSSYYVRKGLSLLSGLQIDPGWDGVLILGLANISPRSISIDYKDSICSIEIHRLNIEPEKEYSGMYMAEQRAGRIPKSNKDYLRTIETMSVSDLTQAMVKMSQSIESLNQLVKYSLIPMVLTFLGVLFSIAINLIK